MKIQKVVIPVAGVGTRLLPVTKSQPKEMLPVGRKPVVQYVVEEAEEAGLRQILFVTGRHKQSIENHFDRDMDLIRRLTEAGRDPLINNLTYEEMAISFFYVRQSVQAGLADAVMCARDFVGDSPFVVSLGDSIIRTGESTNLLARMIEAHVQTGAAATIAVEEVELEATHHYGIVVPEGEPGEVFPIKGLVEKPRPQEAPSRLAIAARYVFDPVLFEGIERTVADAHGELQLTDSIRVLINMGRPVQCVMLGPDEHRYDIGNFANYFKAFVDFALEDEEYGYTLRQHMARKQNP